MGQIQSSNPIGDIDKTTGVYDIHTFRNRLSQSIADCKKNQIMLLRINNFSHINGLYLYAFGDKVLKFFAEEVKKILPSDMELFRLDGAEFGLIYFGDREDLLSSVYHDVSHILENIKIDNIPITLTVSAGICKHTDPNSSADSLYQNAKFALADAKKNKNKCVIYYNNLLQKHQSNMQLLEKLKWSIANEFEGFFLLFQPIVKTQTKEIDGCEALLRWHNPAFDEVVSPTEFIPVLENYGLLTNVGDWVIDNAFRQCAEWSKIMPDFQMNINVSASQFKEAKFVPFVLDKIKEYKLVPQRITLELTESEQIDFAIVNDAFSILRKHGIMTAFDDFGTGYSSVDIFRTISADELKVDRSFIENISYSVTDQVVLKSIINMCKQMDIMVCVEGIEDKESEAIVTQMNPEVLQGYLYGRPMSHTEFELKYLNIGEEKLNIKKTESIRPTVPLKALALINGISCGILQMKMGEIFTVLAYNDGFRRMTEFTIDELMDIKDDPFSLIHCEDRNNVMFELNKQLNETGIASTVYRLLTASGEYIWVIAVCNIIENSDGTPTLVMTLTNINALKQTGEL